MDALNWRKASYSASNGGGCVEVGGAKAAVLVRDTQDRTGPVLVFSAGAWRRFADQVKRSLAPRPVPGPRPPWRALPDDRGAPRHVWRYSPAGRCGPWPGVGAAHLFSVRAGVGVVSESVVVRGARPRAGGGRRGSGGTGNRALGGSGFPRCLHLPPVGSRSAVCVFCRAERGAWALSTVTCAGSACNFPGHSCGGYWCCFAPSPVMCVMSSPFSAVPDWSPLVSVYSRSRDGGSRPRSQPVKGWE